MDLTTEQRTEYTTLIDQILANADLTTVSAKKIRNTMAEKLGYDISDKKEAIGALIGERFDNMAQPSPEPSSDSAPIAQKAQANGHSKHKANNGVKRRVSPSVDAREDSDLESPPKKKHRKQPDNDAKLAAKLQAEENSRARPTRGGVSKKATPAKKKKAAPKKKSDAKIKADDDSDMDLGSDGEKVPKKGAFNKEWILSTPLAELVGESQLSRPQVVKKIWVHIKAHDLQDPEDKRQILCDDKMYAVFKQDKVHMFTMNKLLSKQLYPIEES